MTDIRTTLAGCYLFAGCAPDELDTVAGYAGGLSIATGGVVFEAGTRAAELVIVARGQLLVRKALENGRFTQIARYIAGDSFGEFDLFAPRERDSEIVAEEDCDLVLFPRPGADIAAFVENHANLTSRILHPLIAMVASRIRSVNKLISEKTPWIQELRRKLLVDGLTGLYNRTYLEEDFAGQLENLNAPLSMLYIKPDNFKTINDGYGHAAGDQALRLLAIFVASALRESDRLVRYRGDEFVILLPDTEIFIARALAQEVLQAIADMDLEPITGAPIDWTASAGVAEYQPETDDIKSLTARAQEKMLVARNAGGGRIHG